jgi:hypothetical protein
VDLSPEEALQMFMRPDRFIDLPIINMTSSYCNVAVWKERIEPYWRKRLRKDKKGHAEEHKKILQRGYSQVESVPETNLLSLWGSLCYHPRYLTYMECVPDSNSSTGTGKCTCHRNYTDFEPYNGICKVKLGGRCGSALVCSSNLACVEKRCALRNSTASAFLKSAVLCCVMLCNVLYGFLNLT